MSGRPHLRLPVLPGQAHRLALALPALVQNLHLLQDGRLAALPWGSHLPRLNLTCSKQQQLDRLVFPVLLQSLADTFAVGRCLLLLLSQVAGTYAHPAAALPAWEGELGLVLPPLPLGRRLSTFKIILSKTQFLVFLLLEV